MFLDGKSGHGRCLFGFCLFVIKGKRLFLLDWWQASKNIFRCLPAKVLPFSASSTATKDRWSPKQKNPRPKNNASVDRRNHPRNIKYQQSRVNHSQEHDRTFSRRFERREKSTQSRGRKIIPTQSIESIRLRPIESLNKKNFLSFLFNSFH